MKLHLPTRLRAAVLACITAVAALSTTIGTGVVTVGSVTYVMAASQAQAVDEIVFGGTIYTVTPAATNKLHDCTFNETTYESGVFTVTETTGAWSPVCASDNYNTLRFVADTAENTEAKVQFNTLKISGLIVESTAATSTLGSEGSRSFLIGKADTTSTSVIKKDFNVTASAAITLAGNQTWMIDSGKTYTVSAANGVTDNATALKIQGGGKAKVQGSLTMAAAAAITLTNASALEITGTLSLDLSSITADSTPYIDGSGCLVSATGLTLNNYEGLAAGDYKLISTTSAAADDLAALFASSSKYTVSNKDGVVTLTVAASSDLVWNGGNGTWDDSAENWLSGETAAHFAPNDSVTFATADAQVTISGDKMTSAIQIDADTAWTGTATVSTKTLAGTGTLSLDSGVTLAVAESATGVTINGSGTYAINAGSSALGVTLGDAWTGTVSLNHASNALLNVTNLNLNTYGKAGSSVKLTAAKGHFLKQNAVFAPNLVLSNSPDGSKAALEISNGYSTNTYTFAGNISGTGNWVINSTTSSTLTQNYIFTGDLSGWTGNMTQLNSVLNLTFNGDARQVGANFSLNGGTTNINGDGEVTVNNVTLSGSTVTVNTAMHANTVTMRGSAVTLNADLKVNGALNLASDVAAAAGKVLTLADGVSVTAASMTNAWGAVLHLGTDSALTVEGTASISSGSAQRIWEGAGADVSTVSFGGLTTGNYANTVFRGLALHIGASGITQAGTANRIVLDDASLAADASFSATSDSQTIGFIELVNSVTVATGEHNVAIGSKVTGEGSLTKTGEGTLTLSGTNDFSGGLTVSEGNVTATAASALGAGAVEVDEGATLELSVGNVLAEGQTVTNAGTVVLHDTVTIGSIVNNGSLVIASGFSGLESAGIRGIESVSAEGNGFAQGGTATIFTPATATISGTLTATFGSSTVTIDEATGQVTLGDDWGTYHMTVAPTATETFGAISAAAAAQSATLTAIEITPTDTTLTVDADGLATSMLTGEGAASATLAVQTGKTVTVDTTTMNAVTTEAEAEITLNMGASAALNLTGAATLHVTGTEKTNTLDLGSAPINRALTIVGATVISSHHGDKNGFNQGTTFIGADGTLKLTGGNDALGWDDSAAGTITMLGEEGKLATFALSGRATLKTSIEMQGNSLITAINPDDHSTPMMDPFGGTLTVSGTNNTITTGVRQRSSWEVTVAEEASLAFVDSVLTREGEASNGIVKKGEGTLTFRNASGVLHKYTADAGETVLDNSTFSVGGNLDLSHSDAAAGVVKMINGSALNFANGINLWMNGNTSVALDETSSLNFTRDDYSLKVAGATEGTLATIAGTRNAYYDLNDAVVFSDADVTMTSEADKTIGTKMVNSSITNAGSGTLTVSHAENTTLAAVNAQGGNITLGAATSIGSLTIAGGKTVTASAEGALTITSALTAGAGATLTTALSIANGASLDLVTGEDALSIGSNVVTLGTGLTVTEGMMTAITGLTADQSLTLIKGVSSLTGGDVAASTVISGLTGDYTIKVKDGNLVIGIADAPAADLTWLGGDGTWGDASTPWTAESGASAYIAGANVTIGGESGAEGGTITVSGAQTAASVTIAESGYTIKRADTGSNSLTITGTLTVNEGVTANLGFMPTVDSIVLNDNSVLDMTTAIPYIAADNGATGAAFADMLAAVSGTGKVQMTGDVKVQLGGGSAAQQTAQTFATDFSVDGMLKLQNWQNETTWTLAADKTLDVTGDLWMSNKQTLSLAAGSTVNAGTLHLGMHEQGGEYKGILTSTDATINVGHFIIEGSNAETAVTINGGTVTITDTNAFEIAGVTADAATVSVSGATIKTGTENDTTWNHNSTLTNVTLAAAEDHSITVGAAGIETTLVGTLTNTGTAALAGTLNTTDLTGVTNSGDLTINAESVSLTTLSNTGSVTVTGDVELTTATTAGGDLSAADVMLTGANTFGTLTATGTVTTDDTLTVGDGSDMAAVSEGTKLTTTGDVSIGSDASLAALSNAGNTLTVDGALTLTAATTAGGSVAADSLSLTGVNTFETLTLTGAVTLDTASYTSVGLTAGAVTGNSLALVVDQATIVTVIGASTNALTLANVTGLTGATINGGTSFKDGSREYTISVTEGLVQITATITNEVVWEGTEGEVWGDDAAWESGKEPTADSNVMFNANGIDDVKIGGTAVANSVIVESSKNFTTDATGTVEAHSLEINSGTLTIDENVAVVISGKDEAKGNTGVSGDGNIIIKGALETDVLAAASKDVQLSGSLTIKDSALIGSIGGITEGQNTAYGDLIVGDMLAPIAEGDPVAGKVTLAEDSTVQNLTVTSTGDLTAEKKLTVLGDMLNVGSTTVKGDLTQGTEDTTTDTLTNRGTLNVTGTLTSENLVTESGSTLKAANLAADTLSTEGDITVTGTTTVSGDLTATGGELRTNNLTMDGESATLDVSGTGTIVAVGGASSVDIDSVSVTNGGLFSSQSGNVTATTVSASGAGSILSANNATITADSVSVTNGGAIQSDTGASLKSTIKTDDLTIDGTDSVVKVKGVAAKTAGAQTSVDVKAGGSLVATETVAASTVTVSGAGSSLTAGGGYSGGVDATTLDVKSGAALTATSVKAKNATLDGTGTTATIGLNNMEVEETLTVTNGATLQGDNDYGQGGDITANKLVIGAGSSVMTTAYAGSSHEDPDMGDVKVKELEVASTGSLAVAGTLTTDKILGTAGSITADTLDLSGLTEAAKIAALKANTITLTDFNMLTVTDSIGNVAGTGAAEVSLTLSAATLNSLSTGDEMVVVTLDNSVTGQGITMSTASLAAINAALKAHGMKGEMETKEGKYVMVIKDNSFLSQLGSSENGLAGLALADAAADAGVDTHGDLAAILQHLDELRAAGTDEAAAAGDKIGAALSGASVAAMGAALSGDVERQLKAIRNRTTVMGVNQAVVNEEMPYLNAWVNAEGDYRDISADGTMPGYKMTSWGGTVGFDVDCTPSFTCGLAATAMYGDFTSTGDDHGEGELNTYYVSAFGRYAKHRWTHTFVATAGMADTSLDRTVDGVKVTGDSEGTMFGGMYEVGYVFALDKEATTCLQPIVNVSYTHATLSGYDESGSDVALKTGDVEMNKLTVGVGARLQSVIGENIYNRSSLFEARALVKFDAGDRQGEVTNSFVKYAGSADAKSVETGAIGGEFGMGVTIPVGMEGGNIFMDASAEIRADYVNVNGTVGYRVNF